MVAELHVNLGMEPKEYARAWSENYRQRLVGYASPLPITTDPRYHAHPAFGVRHLHGPVTPPGDPVEARRPHVHRPVVSYEVDPVFLDEA